MHANVAYRQVFKTYRILRKLKDKIICKNVTVNGCNNDYTELN